MPDPTRASQTRSRPVARPRAPLLGHGEFFGSYRARHQVAQFELAMITPDPCRSIERHTHADAHFVLLLDGLYVSSAEGAPSIASGPLLIYNPPGTTHRDRFEPRDGALSGRFLTLSITAERLADATENAPIIDHATRLTHADSFRLAERLARECTAWERDSATVVEALALELLGCVSRAPRTSECAPPRWLRSARDVMFDRYAEDLRVSAVAAMVGVHPVHLARVFRRFYRCTPGDFVRQRRLECGVTLLRETTLPISDVALSAGYVDQSHFSRACQRAFGITPGQLRRQARAFARSTVTDDVANS